MTKLIYTTHAKERMFLRNISKKLIKSALNDHDDRVHEDDGDTKFIKDVKRHGTMKAIHVVAKPLPEEGRDTWLIKTVWIRGEDDPNFIVKTGLMLLFRLRTRLLG